MSNLKSVMFLNTYMSEKYQKEDVSLIYLSRYPLITLRRLYTNYLRYCTKNRKFYKFKVVIRSKYKNLNKITKI